MIGGVFKYEQKDFKLLYVSEGGFCLNCFFLLELLEKKKKSTRNLMNGFACDGFSEFGSKHFGGSSANTLPPKQEKAIN